MTQIKPSKYDLTERTSLFGEAVIKFCKTIGRTTVTIPLISQLVRSATSVGANYCEADCAESKKDFEHKLGICKKEAKETFYWLRMMITATPEVEARAKELQQEAYELNLIFISIIKKSRLNSGLGAKSPLEIRY